MSAKDIQWANVILVMETKHKQQLLARFPYELQHTEMHVLDIPDDYQFMDDELIECLHNTVDELLDLTR